MRIGITGSRTLSAKQKKQADRILRGILSNYGVGDELHHGGAQGIDSIAVTVAKRYGLDIITHVAKTPKWTGDSGYQAKNREIVNNSDVVYALHSPDSSTGGTIWTYNYAAEIGKTCEWIELTV